MTTIKLREKFWKKGEEPFYAQQVIIGLVKSLAKKTKQIEDYRVLHTERAGPTPIEVWATPKG